MDKMNPVVHFEMPAEDKGRMRKFYESAFGWRTKQLGKEMGEYVVVTTSESDPNDLSGRPKRPGTINGGFYQRPEDPAGQYPSIVIAVDDIHESMKKVESAGGKIHGKPYEIPGVGLYVSIIDTEGNRVSMLQPKNM
jgi:predicted enzyme related to lactoylglutathione lyase